MGGGSEGDAVSVGMSGSGLVVTVGAAGGGVSTVCGAQAEAASRRIRPTNGSRRRVRERGGLFVITRLNVHDFGFGGFLHIPPGSVHHLVHFGQVFADDVLWAERQEER